jgi:excisionase family DNA binding protein
MATEQLRLPEPDQPDVTLRAAPLLLTILETAALLSVGRTTVYELIGAGELETVHIGRSVRVPADALRRYISGLRRNPMASE